MDETDDRSNESTKQLEDTPSRSGDARQRRLAEALRRNLRRRKGISSEVVADNGFTDDGTKG